MSFSEGPALCEVKANKRASFSAWEGIVSLSSRTKLQNESGHCQRCLHTGSSFMQVCSTAFKGTPMNRSHRELFPCGSSWKSLLQRDETGPSAWNTFPLLGHLQNPEHQSSKVQGSLPLFALYNCPSFVPVVYLSFSLFSSCLCCNTFQSRTNGR